MKLRTKTTYTITMTEVDMMTLAMLVSDGIQAAPKASTVSDERARLNRVGTEFIDLVNTIAR